MISFVGFENIPAFIKAVSLEMARLDREVSRWFEKTTKEIYRELVVNSPQWTGDYAANWYYTVHAPTTTYSMIANRRAFETAEPVTMPSGFKLRPGFKIKRLGDMEAVSVSLARAVPVKPSWRDIVYFTNTARPEGVEPQPGLGEKFGTEIKLRPVNLVNGQVAQINFILDKYGRV